MTWRRFAARTENTLNMFLFFGDRNATSAHHDRRTTHAGSRRYGPTAKVLELNRTKTQTVGARQCSMDWTNLKEAGLGLASLAPPVLSVRSSLPGRDDGAVRQARNSLV